jgi:hypothetical protein
MNFREWLLLEKFMNDRSAYCGECHRPLLGEEIVRNYKHIYDIGQMRQCTCGKSKVWTNSIRNEVNLVAYLTGKSDRYYNGFCNDKFCGVCFKPLYPLQNGVNAPFRHPNRMDRWGCTKGHNDNILFDMFLEDKELESHKVLDWYRTRLRELEQIMQQDAAKEPAA